MISRLLVAGVLVVAVLVSFAVAGEPGIISDQSDQSAVQEIVGQRNANTRVWEYTRQVPVIDNETGNTKMVTVQNQVYEKADNLCYNISNTNTPEWAPTIEEIIPTTESGFAYQAKQGAYQVSFVGDLTSPWSIIYQVKDQTIRLGVKYLGYYDSSNGNSVFLATANSVVPQLVAPNKLVYRNAFPGVDIEYVYTKGAFLQNAIINSVSSYQSPTYYGLNPASTYFFVATELDLADNSAIQLSINDHKYTGSMLVAPKGYPISVSNTNTGEWLCNFSPNYAYDSSKRVPRNEIPVRQHLVTFNGKHYFIEGISYSWLNSATFPVTIDYELKSGGINGNDTWQSRKTYYVSGAVTVLSPSILTIQGNAIVKFAPSGGQITVNSGAKIIAQGSKFNYVLFTSANDDNVGAATPHGSSVNYPCAIQLNAGSADGSKIRYCKIRYATDGIRISAALATNNQIQNNIIREVSNCGIKVSGSAVLKNNLIVPFGPTSGIWVAGGGRAIIQSHSINSGWMGVYVESNSYASVTDTLISNVSFYAIYSCANCTLNHDYNAFYNAPLPTTPNEIKKADYENNLTANPYVSSPNGDYYLNQDSLCIDAGFETALVAEMREKTTNKPNEITTYLTGENTWGKIARDGDNDPNNEKVDIGYHYDPVDYVIGTNPSNYQNIYFSGENNNLSIDSGVVVSFFRNVTNNQAKIWILNESKIRAVGWDCDTGFIQFTSIYATSDQIQSPLRGGLDTYDYYAGIVFDTGSDPDSDIQYCDFKYADTGIRLLESMNLNRPIQNNYFAQNYYGIAFDSSANNVVNNIFEQNHFGVALRLNALQNQQQPPKTIISYIQSNTFYGNDTGISVIPSSSFCWKVIARTENNIFSSNIGGVIGQNTPGCTIISETRNNIYWNNQQNVDGSNILVNTSGGENSDIVNDYCPMLVHKATLSDNQRVEVTYPHDGFYLAQQDQDASRLPMRINDLADIDITGLSGSMPMTAVIEVYACENWGAHLLGSYYYDYDYNQFMYHDGETGWGNLLVRFYSPDDEWYIYPADYITLTFGSANSKLNVHLPEIDLAGANPFWAWVAQDGSSYYTRSDRQNGDPTQDAHFAMQYDMPSITGRTDTGLAMSAYDGGYTRYGTQAQARSPAVDKGAVKVTRKDAIETEEDVMYSIFASTGLTSTDDNSPDCNTTIRYIHKTISENIPDPLGGILDLGYHYKRGVVYVTDACDTVEETIGGETYQYCVMLRDDETHTGSEIKDITIGNFNSQTFETDEILIYGAVTISGFVGTEYPRHAVVYHVKNTPINRVLVSFVPSYRLTRPTGLMQQLRDIVGCAAPDGTLYCGVAYNIWPDSDDVIEWTVITVYRYQPNTGTWTVIAGTLSGPDTRDMVNDFALATDNTNVWIALNDEWWYTYPTPPSTIRVAIVSNTGFTPLGLDDYKIVKTFSGDHLTPIDMTYDAAATSIEQTPTYRLVYKYEDGMLYELKLQPDVNGYPSVARENEISTDNVSDAPATIVYNPNDPTGGSQRAYTSYSDYNNVTIYAADLNAIDPIYGEQWYADNIYNDSNNISGSDPDVTYRTAGSKLVVYWLDQNPYSNLESNAGQIAENGRLPKLATEPVTQRDIIAGWYVKTVDYPYVLEEGLLMRELYP